MKKVVFAVLFAVSSVSSVLVVGCNNGSCDYVSKCPNDPAATANDTTLCQNRKDESKCGGLYNDYLACYQSNQTCTSSGVTDLTITNGTCGDQFAKWQDCYFGVGGPGADAGDQ
ncbi:MAG TPA: hypothetical protein VGH28_15005 [Polyangiaceae bacterium]|jgi:hypothetical protein